MSERETIAGMPVEHLIANIGSSRLTPGAGSAGAVALALAAACATKAASISLKHHPAEASLQHAAATFERVARLALADADRDAAAFAAFVRSPGSDQAARLVREGDGVRHLIAALLSGIEAIETRIESNMAGDLLAARALANAALAIEESNADEIKRTHLAPGT